MIIEIPTTKKVNVKFIIVKIPVRYGDEDMAYDFPLRCGDEWIAIIDLDTHKIENWEQGKSGNISMKVCDKGIYTLLDENKEYVAQIAYDYVPNGVIPGEYGDYIEMEIDEAGKVTNMPSQLNFDGFFNGGQ